MTFDTALPDEEVTPLRGWAAESFFVVAPLFLFWLLFNTWSASPGNIDPRSAYANMTGLYVYFLFSLAALFVVDFSGKRKQWLDFVLLAAVLLSYPFLFVYTHHAGVIDNPPTGSFPYYRAILRSAEIPWRQLFLDPWGVLASPEFGAAGPRIFDISPLLRTKLPGFALTAKLLSYVVSSQWTYLVVVASLTFASQLLIARALLADYLKEMKWYLLALLPAVGFLIQPYGVEQIATLYLGLCLFFLYRFKKTGGALNLLGSLAAGAFLILNSASAIQIVPFVLAFAFFDNPFKKKALFAGLLLAALIFWGLHSYFRIATARQDITFLDYYLSRSTAEFTEQVDRPESWGITSVLTRICIAWGPVLVVSLVHMVFKPWCKWALLFLLSVVPVMAFDLLVGATMEETYRSAYACQIISLFVCFGLIGTFRGAGDGMSREIRLKILMAGSVLTGIMFHKLYAVPEVRLRPFLGDSPPHPMWGGWEYHLSRDQIITPDILVMSFIVWVLCLNLKRDGERLFAASGGREAWLRDLRQKRSLRSLMRAHGTATAVCFAQLAVISVFTFSLVGSLKDANAGRDNLLIYPGSARSWSYPKPESAGERVGVRRPLSLFRWSPVIHFYNDREHPTFEMDQYIQNLPEKRLRLEADVYVEESHNLAKSGFYVWFFARQNRPAACLAIVVAGGQDYFNPENALLQDGAFFRATKIIRQQPRRWNHLSLDLADEYDALVRSHLSENRDRYLFDNLPVTSVRFEMFSWTEGDGKIAVAYDNVKLTPLSRESQAGRRAEGR